MERKELIIKEIEEGLLKMPCSELLDEEDWKGRTMDELPEILVEKLLPAGIRAGFNAGFHFKKRKGRFEIDSKCQEQN